MITMNKQGGIAHSEIEVNQPIAETPKQKFVRIENGQEFICELPVARNFNDGTGALFWCNLGFETYDSYMDKKIAREASARAVDAANKELETAKAELAKMKESESVKKVKSNG
jgi:hypothetical protein